jgi:hypothetical protein
MVFAQGLSPLRRVRVELLQKEIKEVIDVEHDLLQLELAVAHGQVPQAPVAHLSGKKFLYFGLEDFIIRNLTSWMRLHVMLSRSASLNESTAPRSPRKHSSDLDVVRRISQCSKARMK